MFASAGILSSYKNSVDADAQAFIDATGITDATQKTAINDLVVAAKAHGWWVKCSAIYPMVGGTATTCKYNLKNPLDTDAAFRLSFVNTPTISGNGVDWNGTTQYANTFLNPSTVLTANDTHISCYLREDIAGLMADIGADVASADQFFIYPRFSTSLLSYQYDFSSRAVALNSSSTGYFLCSRVSNTDHVVYKNGSSLGSNSTATATTMPNCNFFLGATNFNGTAGDYSSREMAFATIGAGISSSIQGDMYTDIQAFQTAIGRNV